MYASTVYENETNELASAKSKLNKLREVSLKTNYMQEIEIYNNNMDYYRNILASSNPVRSLGFYDKNISPKFYNAKEPESPKFDVIQHKIVNTKNYCDLADANFLFFELKKNEISYYRDAGEKGINIIIA